MKKLHWKATAATRNYAAPGRITRRSALGKMSGSAVALCAPLLLSACGQADETSKRSELLVVDTPHPLSFEPSSTGRIYTQMGVAETLIEADGDGLIQPGLATSWGVTEDGLVWSFKLRSNASFHDGTPFTADLVARALNRARGRPGVMSFVSFEDIAADGDILRIRLKERTALLLPVLSTFSTQILAPASFDADNRAVAVVGTGPFKVRSVTEQELVVELWDGWQGPKPHITSARYLSAGRAETRGVLAESGQADIVHNLDTATEARLRNRPNISVLSVPCPRTTYIKVNAGHRFLNDVRARRALSLAVDREGIAKGLLGNPDRAARQLIPPYVKDWHQSEMPSLMTDTAEASRLLSEIGWTTGADGILTKNGEPFRLTLLTHSVTPELQVIASALQEQFRKVGIDINVRIGASAETPTTHNNGTLELALVNRSFMLVADPAGALFQDYGGGGGEYGAMNWKDEEVTAALAELKSGTEAVRAQALRERVVQVLQDQLPVIPIVHNPRTAAISGRIENAIVDPLERTYGLSHVRWRQQ